MGHDTLAFDSLTLEKTSYEKPVRAKAWIHECDGLETQPRVVRKLAESSVRCQAIPGVKKKSILRPRKSELSAKVTVGQTALPHLCELRNVERQIQKLVPGV